MKINKLFSKFGLLAITAFFIVLYSLLNPHFLNLRNLNSSLMGQIFTAMVGLAAMMTLIVGEVNMSIGNCMAFCGIIIARVSASGVTDPIVIILVALAAGIASGFITGILVVLLDINSSLATMGIGQIFYGIVLFLSDGLSITNCVPPGMRLFARTRIFEVNVLVWLVLGIAVIMGLVLNYTPFGKRLYATGASRRVAHLSGINTMRMRFVAYVVAGVIVSFAALFSLMSVGNYYNSTGPNYMLPGMAFAYLSITTFRAGRFNVFGMLVGVLMLSVIFSGLNLLSFPFWVENMVNGVILLIVILCTGSESRRVQVG